MGFVRDCLFAFSLASALSAGVAHAADPVKIGMVGPLTGPAANTGLTVRATYELLTRQINESGGLEIDGVKRPVELLSADSQGKPNIGVSAAQKLLIRDKVDLLVGDLLYSDVTLAVTELAPAYPNTVFYVPLPVSSTISERVATSPEKYGNIWKWIGDAEAYGKSVSDFLKIVVADGKRTYKKKTYAVISEATDYAAAIVNSVKTEVSGNGWTLAAVETVPIGTTDFFAQISKMRAIEPDVVITIFTAGSTGIAYVKQAKEQQVKYEDIAIYYPTLSAFRDGIGANGNGLIFLGGVFDGKRTERGRAFSKLLQDNKIAPSGDAVLGYCSAKVLFDAIKSAKSVSVDKLNSAFLAIDDDTCPSYVRVAFNPKRHSPKLGAEGFFMHGSQMYDDGKDFLIFYPEKAATGKLDEIPAVAK